MMSSSSPERRPRPPNSLPVNEPTNDDPNRRGRAGSPFIVNGPQGDTGNVRCAGRCNRNNKIVVQIDPPTYVAQDYSVGNPCCMSFTVGMCLIVFIEVIVYSLGIAFYAYFYQKLQNTVRVSDTRDIWSVYHYYRSQMASRVPFNQITEYLSSLALAEIICCSCYVVVSLMLLIGISKRVAVICWIWVSVILALTIARLAILILGPIAAFQLGFIWFVIELYFIYIVICFAVDCNLNPTGNEIIMVPYSEAMFDTGAFVGYQLAGYRPTTMAQVRRAENPNNNGLDPLNNNVVPGQVQPDNAGAGRPPRDNNEPARIVNNPRQVRYSNSYYL